MLFGLISPCTTIPCLFQKRLSKDFPKTFPSFLQFGQVVNIHVNLFQKILSDLFQPPIPQAEKKEDDEHFANHLQIYVSRTFTKAKKSALCTEYPMSPKFHLSKWKTLFSQFIDNFLKLEEVEYLIHYVKFKMWPALFYVNSLYFSNIFECWC